MYITKLECPISLLKSLLASCLYLNSLSKTCIFALLKTFFYITLPAISILIHCRSNVFICPACNVLLYSFGGGFVSCSLSKKCVYFPCLKRIAIYTFPGYLYLIHCRQNIFICPAKTYCSIALRALYTIIHGRRNVLISPGLEHIAL